MVLLNLTTLCLYSTMSRQGFSWITRTNKPSVYEYITKKGKQHTHKHTLSTPTYKITNLTKKKTEVLVPTKMTLNNFVLMYYLCMRFTKKRTTTNNNKKHHQHQNLFFLILKISLNAFLSGMKQRKTRHGKHGDKACFSHFPYMSTKRSQKE